MIWFWMSEASAIDLSEGDPVAVGMVDGIGALVVIDADGDGDGEIATGGDDLRLWDQQPDGRWIPTVLEPVAGTLTWTALVRGDFDGDGLDDLLARGTYGTGTHETSVRLGSAALAEVATSSLDLAGAPADVDGDGDLDVVGVTQWFENRLGGTAWIATPLPVSFTPFESAAGDLDGDGDPDVIVNNDGRFGDTAWLESDGTGFGWTEHSLGPADGVWVADLDRDGDLDLIFESGDAVLVSLNDPALPERFGPRVEIFRTAPFDDLVQVVSLDGAALARVESQAWYELGPLAGTLVADLGWLDAAAVGDVDGDGADDLLARQDTQLAWWSSFPAAPERGYVAGEGPFGTFAAADVDGDGDQDLLALGLGTFDWYENLDGYGVRWTGHHVPTGPRVSPRSDSGSLDWDLDGDPDVVLYDEDTDAVSAWLDDGAGAFTPTEVLAGVVPNGIAAGDIDGDGVPDLVTTGDDLTVWLADGAGYTPIVVEAGSGSEFTTVSALDLDLDGDLDLVAASTQLLSELSWYENRNGAGTVWTEVVVGFDPPAGCGDFHAMDFDGDADLDLVAAGPNGPSFYLFEMTAPFGQAWEDESPVFGSWPGDVAVADLDLDGDPDVLTADPWDGRAWWENQTFAVGTPNFDGWTFGDESSALTIIDLDGDGDEDAVVHDEATGALTAYRNHAATPLDDADGDGRPDADDACPEDYQTDDSDTDGDGFPPACDCHPVVATISPGAPEICDAVDNDCDLELDEGFDADGDGITVCGWDGIDGNTDDDCDDGDATIRPGIAERCDGVDTNCDGVMEPDTDGDGAPTCMDCDDTNPAVSPLVVEAPYDGADNDCDPLTPDDDLDLDGFDLAFDCDDDDPAVSPAEAEVPYDGVDNDCSAATPDDDADLDGFVLAEDCDDLDPAVSPGEPEVPYDEVDNDCAPETPDDDIDLDGFVLADDCDDTDPLVSPGAPEVPYDGVDNDCLADSADDDVDGDGFLLADDCDDTDPERSPAQAEVPYDGVDNDCSAATSDEDFDRDGVDRSEDCDDDDPAVGVCDTDAVGKDGGGGGGGGCGCAGAPAGGGTGWWVLGALLLTRRLRSPLVGPSIG